MKDDTLRKVSLSRDLQHALDNREFILEYQPVVDLNSTQIVGAEALLRWQHPQKGKIYPNDFIPLAEDNNLILPLGEWVLETVLDNFQGEAHPALNDLKISINLSGQQLGDDHHFRNISNQIKISKIDPARIQLEITETSIFENVGQTTHELKRLESLGVKLAIDDFGTGYSSLSYMEQFPNDAIKIDIPFIKRIKHRKIHLPILKGIISIAHEMGLDVIAEGVETQAQVDYLQDQGCNLMQGYYFYKPVSLSELIETIEAQ